jgi:hypothetical protein
LGRKPFLELGEIAPGATKNAGIWTLEGRAREKVQDCLLDLLDRLGRLNRSLDINLDLANLLCHRQWNGGKGICAFPFPVVGRNAKKKSRWKVE